MNENPIKALERAAVEDTNDSLKSATSRLRQLGNKAFWRAQVNNPTVMLLMKVLSDILFIVAGVAGRFGYSLEELAMLRFEENE